MPKLTFLFVRHAESEANIDLSKEDRIGGHNSEVPLTENGKKQAKMLGEYFQKESIHFSEAYSSPAVRTLSTAAICFKEMGCNLEVKVDKRLHEQTHGDWDGLPRHDIYREREDVINGLRDDNWGYVPGDKIKGESKTMVAKRMLKWLNEKNIGFNEDEENQYIAVFTHGLAIKFLLAELLNLDRATAYKDEVNPIHNSSITEVCYQPHQEKFIVNKRNFRV
jgi:broad specificity phosphatase PhoE